MAPNSLPNFGAAGLRDWPTAQIGCSVFPLCCLTNQSHCVRVFATLLGSYGGLCVKSNFSIRLESSRHKHLVMQEPYNGSYLNSSICI